MPICYIGLCRTHAITPDDGGVLLGRIPIMKGKKWDGNIASIDVQKIEGFNCRVFRMDDRFTTSDDLYAVFWGIGIADEDVAKASRHVAAIAKAEVASWQRFVGCVVVRFNGGANVINDLHAGNANGIIFA